MTSAVCAGTIFGPCLWPLSAHRHSLMLSIKITKKAHRRTLLITSASLAWQTFEQETFSGEEKLKGGQLIFC